MNRAQQLTVAIAVTGLLVSGATLAKGGWFHHGMSIDDGSLFAQQQREFNQDEIAILMQAKLLRRGNPNVKLGKVTKTDTGFAAEIVTKQEGSLVETLALDSYGRPVDRLQRKMKKSGGKGNCQAMAGNSKPGQKRMQQKRVERLNSDRQLTKDQVKTLMEARLINRGNPNIKLGTVNEVGENFKVTIVTQDNALVRELTLNPAGFPIARN